MTVRLTFLEGQGEVVNFFEVEYRGEARGALKSVVP